MTMVMTAQWELLHANSEAFAEADSFMRCCNVP